MNSVKTGDELRLTAKNRKGRNVIHRHGSEWVVDEVCESVMCLNNKPGMLIRSKTNDRRWILLNDCGEFNVQRI